MRLIDALSTTYNLSVFKGVIEHSHVAEDDVSSAYVVRHQKGERPYVARIVALAQEAILVYDVVAERNVGALQPRGHQIVKRALPRRFITSVEKTYDYLSPDRRLDQTLHDFKAVVVFSADSRLEPLELVVNEDAYNLAHDEELARLMSFVDELWGAD
jgi:hypothetical protein